MQRTWLFLGVTLTIVGGGLAGWMMQGDPGRNRVKPRHKKKTAKVLPQWDGLQMSQQPFAEQTPSMVRPFSVLATDRDLDGDIDVAFNHQNLDHLEIWDNDGGRFVLRNPPGSTFGPFENPGIPWIYAEVKPKREEVASVGVPGLHLWHAPLRKRAWHVFPKGEVGTIRIEANAPITRNNAPGGARRPDENTLELTAPTEWIWFETKGVATTIRVTAEVPIYVGAASVPVGKQVTLTKPDHRGMTWVQVAGSPEPELFATRGALRGALQPPLPPKQDLLWELVDGRYRLVADHQVPANYGRGRQAAWVDVDGDGKLELYIGNKDSNNALLGQKDGKWVDQAKWRALDLEGAWAFAWLDLDADGDDDLVHLTGHQFGVSRNDKGTFSLVDGDTLGLDNLPKNANPHDKLELTVLDVDNDGQLDLLLSGISTKQRVRAYRGLPDGTFEPISKEAGLAGVRARQLLPFDADNDGLVDLFVVGKKAGLLHNDGGFHFTAHRVAAEGMAAGQAADVDGDGRTDIVAATKKRFVLRNTDASGNGYLRVSAPIGTVVKAHYDDEGVQAQRAGSMSNAGQGQSVQPLHFGVPGGRRITHLTVHERGKPPRRVEVEPGATRLAL